MIKTITIQEVTDRVQIRKMLVEYQEVEGQTYMADENASLKRMNSRNQGYYVMEN